MPSNEAHPRITAQDLWNRPVGQVLAEEPVSIALVTGHEIRNFYGTILMVITDTQEYSSLATADQARNPEEREKWYQSLPLTEKTRKNLEPFLEQTGGFRQRIILRLIWAIPEQTSQRLTSLIKTYLKDQITLGELDATIIECIFASGMQDFCTILEVLGFSKNPKIAPTLETYKERIKAQLVLACYQYFQYHTGEEVLPQIPAMEMPDEKRQFLLAEFEKLLQQAEQDLKETGWYYPLPPEPSTQ